MRTDHDWVGDGDLAHYAARATEIEYPDVASETDAAQFAEQPFTLVSNPATTYWDVPLEEAVQIALVNSKVLIDLGGTVVRLPRSVPTIYGPAVTETDPAFGVDAALSQFDADFATSLFFDQNDRVTNNTLSGVGGLFKQDLGVFDIGITKRSATGGQFGIRKHVEYDDNNNIFPPKIFDSGTWNVNLDVEARQPLLRGAGVEVNRIVGPDALDLTNRKTRGVFNGVLIARIRTDISLADFEIGLRDFVSNVENAYWDLYFAYRDLDTKIEARNVALDTWRRIHALYLAGRKGGEAQNEAQAREQYYRFEEEVQNALTGRLLEGTRVQNGSPGGTFRGTGGVYLAERRLRLLMGLPVSDGRMIRPAKDPITAKLVFDWHEIASESLARRAELRRQQWQIQSRELELIGSRNLTKPQLDLVGRYRWRGFGDELLNPDRSGPRFESAYKDLTSGDFQEWQAGVELNMRLGFRQAHAEVRNAEFQLARDRAILKQQERQVIHEVGDAVGDLERAYALTETTYNLRLAAQQRLEAMKAAYLDEPTAEQLFLLLDAQRRLAEAQSEFYRAQVEYALAVKNVHFAKGSLLEYCGVHTAEGPWPAKAIHDADQLEARRGRPKRIDYRFSMPPLVATAMSEHERPMEQVSPEIIDPPPQ